MQDLSLPGIGVCVPASRTPPRNASGGRWGRWSHEAGLRGGAAGVTLRGSCGLASEAGPPRRPAPRWLKCKTRRSPRAPCGSQRPRLAMNRARSSAPVLTPVHRMTVTARSRGGKEKRNHHKEGIPKGRGRQRPPALTGRDAARPDPEAETWVRQTHGVEAETKAGLSGGAHVVGERGRRASLSVETAGGRWAGGPGPWQKQGTGTPQFPGSRERFHQEKKEETERLQTDTPRKAPARRCPPSLAPHTGQR